MSTYIILMLAVLIFGASCVLYGQHLGSATYYIPALPKPPVKVEDFHEATAAEMEASERVADELAFLDAPTGDIIALTMDTLVMLPADTSGSAERIQRRRVKGWRKPAGVINVTRGSDWGNPFKVGDTIPGPFADSEPIVVDQALAVDMFRRYAEEHGWQEQIRHELRGKDLMCYCPVGTPCHGDYLLELANS